MTVSSALALAFIVIGLLAVVFALVVLWRRTPAAANPPVAPAQDRAQLRRPARKPTRSAPAPRPKPPGSWNEPAKRPNKPPRAAGTSRRKSARSRTRSASCAATSSAASCASPTASSGWTRSSSGSKTARRPRPSRQDLDRRAAELDRQDAERGRELERVAGLTTEAAKAELVAVIENQAKREAALIVRDIEHEAKSEGDKRARKIVTLAIQRVATEQTSESVVSVLHLPGDEMKGRIIGREGRNIRAFESVTGVNLIIDDTPEAVLLSCFDPVRREIARLTLERLIADGRIHPQRIEDAYERGKAEIEQLCQRAGEDALVELGITDMHPELVNLLGRLRYRTSYGQNVLRHLVESAHIAGMMASELRTGPAAAAGAARCCTTSARPSPTRSRAATR